LLVVGAEEPSIQALEVAQVAAELAVCYQVQQALLKEPHTL
jgi:hypothetical protein